MFIDELEESSGQGADVAESEGKRYEADALLFGFAKNAFSRPKSERQRWLIKELQSVPVRVRNEVKLQMIALLMTTLDAKMVDSVLSDWGLRGESLLFPFAVSEEQALEMGARIPMLEPWLTERNVHNARCMHLTTWARMLASVPWSGKAGAKMIEVVRAVFNAAGRDALRLHQELNSQSMGCLGNFATTSDPSIKVDLMRVLLGTGAFTEGGRVHPTSHRDAHDALYSAVSEAPPELVKLLLDAGFDPNGTKSDDHRMTVLHQVHSPGVAEKVRLLVAAGAKLETRDHFGRTPLVASFVSPVPCLEAFTALIDAGADPRVLGERGQHECPIIVAALRGDVEGTRRLLDPSVVPRGIIDPNAHHSGSSGGSAITLACMFDCHRIVRMLIDAGVRFDTAPERCCLPLEFVCDYGSYKSAKVLIKAGALKHYGKHRLLRLLRRLAGEASRSRLDAQSTSVTQISGGMVQRSPEEIKAGMAKIIELLEGCDD